MQEGAKLCFRGWEGEDWKMGRCCAAWIRDLSVSSLDCCCLLRVAGGLGHIQVLRAACCGTQRGTVVREETIRRMQFVAGLWFGGGGLGNGVHTLCAGLTGGMG